MRTDSISIDPKDIIWLIQTEVAHKWSREKAGLVTPLLDTNKYTEEQIQQHKKEIMEAL